MEGRAARRTGGLRTLRSPPRLATVLSALFLLVVVGGAGYVWRTLNVVGRALEDVDFSSTQRLYLVLQAVENLNGSLDAYLNSPTPSALDAVRYALGVTIYEVKVFSEDKQANGELDTMVPVSGIRTVTSELGRLIASQPKPAPLLQQLAPQVGDLLINLQNAYADLTYTAMVRDDSAIRRFGNLSVVTRVVVLLIAASLLFVIVILWLQRRYMVLLNRTHEELGKAKSAAEEANRAKSDFLATISHEIRTPMNAITGLAYLALNYERDSRLMDYLQKIQGSASVLLRIINEVLDFSKIESRKLELDKIPFSLSEVFESLFAIVGVGAQEKGLEILFRSGAAVPDRLVGDPVRLGQVLINIATNAVKYTITGEILVSVRLVDRTEGGIVLRFDIRDSGIGIAQDEQARIFEAFSQAGSPGVRRKGGTGLGLAISKTLVEMMGGTIDVESEPGRGSTFGFTARLEEQSSPDAARGQSAAEFPDTRALVVDDNERARSALMEMLAELKIVATAAESGKVALELIESSDPGSFQMIFVDCHMPTMSGARTISEIRKLSGRIGTAKLVLVTSDARAVIGPETDLAQLDAVLMKPVTPKSLLSTIERILTQESTGELDLDGQPPADAEPRRVFEARVLVVEDNELNQQIAREVLEHAGFRVSLAASGQDALRLLRSQPFHAVLMDMYMPDMDGREATRVIREIDRYQHLPIIAMTANATAEERRRCLQAGMDDFIAKPILPRELISRLARHIAPQLSPEIRSHLAGSEEVPLRPEGGGTGKLDWEGARARVGGNDILLVKLLQKFRARNREAVRELRELLRADDRDGARSRAHSLKGVAANLGADPLREASAMLESKLSSGATEQELEPFLTELARELDAVMAELDSRLPADR